MTSRGLPLGLLLSTFLVSGFAAATEPSPDATEQYEDTIDVVGEVVDVVAPGFLVISDSNHTQGIQLLEYLIELSKARGSGDTRPIVLELPEFYKGVFRRFAEADPNQYTISEFVEVVYRFPLNDAIANTYGTAGLKEYAAKLGEFIRLEHEQGRQVIPFDRSDGVALGDNKIYRKLAGRIQVWEKKVLGKNGYVNRSDEVKAKDFGEIMHGREYRFAKRHGHADSGSGSSGMKGDATGVGSLRSAVMGNVARLEKEKREFIETRLDPEIRASLEGIRQRIADLEAERDTYLAEYPEALGDYFYVNKERLDWIHERDPALVQAAFEQDLEAIAKLLEMYPSWLDVTGKQQEIDDLKHGLSEVEMVLYRSSFDEVQAARLLEMAPDGAILVYGSTHAKRDSSVTGLDLASALERGGRQVALFDVYFDQDRTGKPYGHQEYVSGSRAGQILADTMIHLTKPPSAELNVVGNTVRFPDGKTLVVRNGISSLAEVTLATERKQDITLHLVDSGGSSVDTTPQDDSSPIATETPAGPGP